MHAEPHIEYLKTLTEKLNQKDAELKTNEVRLRLALKAANIGTWHWCIDSDELTWDRRMFEIARPDLLIKGFSPEKFKANHEFFYSSLHEDDFERVRKAVHDSIEFRIPFNIKYRVVRNDGTVRHVKSIGQMLDKGESYCGSKCLTGVCIDVTDELE